MKIKPATRQGRMVLRMNFRDEQPLANGPLSKASPFKLTNILVPIDFSASSLKALQYAVAFAEKYEAAITLLQVIEPVCYPENYLGVVRPDIEDVNVSRAQAAQKKLAALRQSKIDPAIPADLLVHVGRPDDEIINVATDEDMDLIVIATQGHRGLKHGFLGSTAERVVRHAPCPVLVVRERDDVKWHN